MPEVACTHCLAPLQPEDKLCPQCHELVRSAELEALRVQAIQFERNADPANARKAWMAALELLPPDSRQALWIEDHARNLEHAPHADQPKPNPWTKRLGPFAPLVLLLAKAKTLFFALFKLKFLFSFAAFLGLYWALYGAWFGIGFAMMILIHEMGHFAEVKRRGLPANTGIGKSRRKMLVGVRGLGALRASGSGP